MYVRLLLLLQVLSIYFSDSFNLINFRNSNIKNMVYGETTAKAKAIFFLLLFECDMGKK